jgi:sporulation protein YlmC with PRC-barrel domain
MAKNRDVRRDQAGVGPDPSESRRRLVSMDDLSGYTVAKGEPDIRGWEVRTLGGRELGEVEDLLVDPQRGEVVMLEVELRGDGVHAEVPLRSVQIDRKRKVVIVDSGDISDGTQGNVRARDRMDPAERENIRGTYRDSSGEIRYDQHADHERGDIDHSVHEQTTIGDTEETVVERRPMIEEVVVRRRPADE